MSKLFDQDGGIYCVDIATKRTNKQLGFFVLGLVVLGFSSMTAATSVNVPFIIAYTLIF